MPQLTAHMPPFLFILLFLSVPAPAQVKWDGGGGDGQWSNALNWTADIAPAPGDDVVLDNSVEFASYVVHLPSGNVSVELNSIIISPVVDRTIELELPVENTALIALSVIRDGDAIVIDQGGLLRNSSGSAMGTPLIVGAASFLRINNGGRYVHHTERGHTNGLVSRLSNVVGTEEGVFEFDVPGTAAYTVSLSGRTYGQLVFSANAAGAVKTYAGSGTSPVTINGSLVVNSNAIFSYGANVNQININRNCMIAPAGVFNISNGANNSRVIIKGNLNNDGTLTESGSSSGSVIELNGNTMQEISGVGAITQSVQFSINNPSGARLLSVLQLPYRLELLSGKLLTAELAQLVMGDNAIVIGGSPGSFIEGPMRKRGDDAFDFPVGLGGIYAPIGIHAGGLPEDEFKAQYQRANPQTVPGLGNSLEAGIHHISYTEYWTLSRQSGSSSRMIKLHVTPYSFAKSANGLLVASFESGIWQNKGQSNFQAGPPSPPFITGAFSSADAVNTFQAFTIGTVDDEILNPLPVTFLQFQVRRIDDKHASLYWELAERSPSSTSFSIERSGEKDSFLEIGRIKPNGMASSFSFIDASLQRGISYYRITTTDSIGTRSQTPVRMIVNGLSGLWLDQIYPTPARASIRLRILSSEHRNMTIHVMDMEGRMLFQSAYQTSPGINESIIFTQDLRRGVYQVFGTVMGKRTNVLRFLKH